MRSFLLTLLLATAFLGCGSHEQGASDADAQAAQLSDDDIAQAYLYLLGRELVLRQERLDLQEGFAWNQLIHRKPGGVSWPNPNLDVAYSEAWVAVDDNTCVLLEIPEIKGRYYTWQMLNGWGETLLNINERTFPQHPYGKFALCLKGSKVTIPDGALRVDLPSRTARVLARIELGRDAGEAVRLQHLVRLEPQGQPKIGQPISVPLFEGRNLPGVEMFDNATDKMQSEPDINEGMDKMQEKTKAVETLVRSGAAGRARVDSVVRAAGIPLLFKTIQHLGLARNGWSRPAVIGNYKDNYAVRTAVNFGGIWANNMGEVTYFVQNDLDGGATYLLTYPPAALPANKAKYFWSVIAVDAVKYQVLPNTLKKYLLNNQSGLKSNPDGSLTLVFGPRPHPGYPASNWLPTTRGLSYNLTMRFYGPTADVVDGNYFPPALEKAGQATSH